MGSSSGVLVGKPEPQIEPRDRDILGPVLGMLTNAETKQDTGRAARIAVGVAKKAWRRPP